MVRISAAAIVKNEEKNIKNWLNCVKQIADEIVVVDTGSTDNTKQILAANQVKIYDFIWQNDFSAARNYAISKLTGDWIIFLDADEKFSDDSIQLVQKNIKKYHNNKNVDAFFCRYTNFDSDNNNNFISSYYQLRIFRKDDKLYYKNPIHEELQRHDGKDVKMAQLPEISIYHTGYSSSLIKNKLRRNLELIKEEFKKNGEQEHYYAYLGDCYYGLQDYEKAAYYAEKFIHSDLKMLGAELSVYQCWINALYFAGHPYNEVMRVIDSVIAKFADVPDFVFMKGFLLFETQQYVLAEPYIYRTLQLFAKNPTNILSSMQARIFIAYRMMGKIARLKNNVPLAINYYIKSLQENCYIKIYFNEFYALIKNRAYNVQIKFLDKIYGNDIKKQQFLLTCLEHDTKIFDYYNHQMGKNNINTSIVRKSTSEYAICLNKLYKQILLYQLQQKEPLSQSLQQILPAAYQKAFYAAYEKICSK